MAQKFRAELISWESEYRDSIIVGYFNDSKEAHEAADKAYDELDHNDKMFYSTAVYIEK